MTTETLVPGAAEPAEPRMPNPEKRVAKRTSLFEPSILKRAVGESFVKLDPRTMMRNPVMFVVEIGSVLTTLLFFRDLTDDGVDHLFVALVAAWLWFTVLFANFAEAIAEGRGKAQADTLRKTRTETAGPRAVRRRHDRREAVERARPRRPLRRRGRARSSPVTARSSRASPAWTSRPSPASPPR